MPAAPSSPSGAFQTGAFQADAFQLTGAAIEPVGAIEYTEEHDVCEIVATARITGSLDSDDAADICAINATQRVRGTLAVTEEDDVTVMAGDVIKELVLGRLEVIEESDVMLAEALATVRGMLAAIEADVMRSQAVIRQLAYITVEDADDTMLSRAKVLARVDLLLADEDDTAQMMGVLSDRKAAKSFVTIRDDLVSLAAVSEAPSATAKFTHKKAAICQITAI